MMYGALTFFYEQIFQKPKYPTQSFTGQTIIVSGSNVGIGYEAIQHFARLGAAKLIMAVRNIDAGEKARQEIISATKCDPAAIEVWQLDLGSYESVKEFAKRAEGLPRIDAVVENAGKATKEFSLTEDNESTITTNVVSTFLLALLLLPKLKSTAQQHNTRPCLSIVSSTVPFFAAFNERKDPSGKIFETLNSKDKANMGDRYNVSKLLEMYVVKQMAEMRPKDEYPVTINILNPGFCLSSLRREATSLQSYIFRLMELAIAWTGEIGSRNLVYAAGAGPETHGQFLNHTAIYPYAPLVTGKEGPELQQKVWTELLEKLERISPGISQNL